MCLKGLYAVPMEAADVYRKKGWVTAVGTNVFEFRECRLFKAHETAELC